MTSTPPPTPKNLRVFGIGLGLIIALFSLLAWRKGAAWVPYGMAVATIPLVLGLVLPTALEYIYRPWMKVAGFIGRVTTFLSMFIVFYGVITPYAVVLRLLGKDLLKERLRSGDSYWIPKEPVTDMTMYEKQF